MNRYAKQTCSGLFACFVILSGAASGSEVYKWVAADGSTHYSEVRPESELASVEILELIAADPVQSVSQSYQSVLDVANSIEASRLERERLRLEKNKLRLQAEQVSQLEAQNRVEKSYTAFGYYYPRHFRHYRKHKYGKGHPRPEHRLHARGEQPGLNSQGYVKRK